MNTDDRQQLLDRILASRQFAHAESLKRILRYICQQSGDGDHAVREYDIAVNAIGRAKSFDPKTDPIVRVSIAGIRERLRSYFENEGVHERFRLEIPKGQYKALYSERSDAAARELSTGIMRFWRPYLTAGTSNVCIYSEVLFFRDDDFNYVRNIYVNDLSTGATDMQQRMPSVDFTRFKPSYHFVSAGEMHCMMFLSKQFQDIGARVELRNSRFCSWNELRHSNLVLIGSSRINKFVDALQGDLCFYIGRDHIYNRRPEGNELPEYIGRRWQDGKLERVTEYALVTRQPGLTPDTTVTIITANHGRAIEAAGFFVTREDALAGLLQSMGLAAAETMPPRFQVLLEVELIDFDEDIVNVGYVTHRVF